MFRIHTLLVFCCFIVHLSALSQEDRFQTIQNKLNELSVTLPGLNQKIETSVSNSSLSGFLGGLSVSHKLNLNVSTDIHDQITVYFANEKVSTVLLFLAKKHHLDFAFTGSIINIFPYIDPQSAIPKPPKNILINASNTSGNISFDLNNDTLSKVAKLITTTTGINIVVMPDIANKPVTGFINDLPVESAIEKLAIANSFKLTRSKDNVLILENLAANEEIVPRQSLPKNSNYTIKRTLKSNGESTNATANIFLNEAGEKLISLNVTNALLKDIVTNIAQQSSMDYFIYSDLLGTATANIADMPIDKTLSYIFQGTKYTFSKQDGVYLIGDRKDEGLRSSQLIQLKYRSVDSLVHIIPQEMVKNVEVKEFKELNSLLISGSLPQIQEIKSYITEIDRPVPMVLIEVILMDIKKSRKIETGIKVGVSDSVKTGGTLLGGLDFTFGARDINRFIDQIGLSNVFNIGRVTPNFYATLKAMENNSNIELRQTPKLSTLNGHIANLSIGSTRYYSIKTQNTIGSLTPNTIVTEQFFPVDANLEINIKPFVSGDEHITLNIDVNISDFLSEPSLNAPPPSATSKFHSIIRVKNEDMLILGGIERNEKSTESSGVPILSRIPLLKWLFSSRTKVDSKTVSIVFIKPTIIY